MASVAAARKVCGVGPGTVTSTVFHTPSNADFESEAVSLDTVATSSVALSTDTDNRTLGLIDMGPSFDESPMAPASAQATSSAARPVAPNGAPCAILSMP